MGEGDRYHEGVRQENRIENQTRRRWTAIDMHSTVLIAIWFGRGGVGGKPGT